MSSPSENIAVFDKDALARSRARAEENFGDFDFLHEFAQKNIEDRLTDITRKFKDTRAITHDDFSDEIESFDAAPESLDLITSILDMHLINDLPGALFQIKRALKADGLFIAAIFGGETLYQLRESLVQTESTLKGGVSPRVYPFADKQQVGALLQRAGFALPVVDSEIVTVTYENMFKLMRDLRGMGQNNVIAARNRTNPGKAFFMNAAQYYQQHFAESDGRIPATFEIIFMIGWAPHESQQKPLKPGSADTRLADALKTQEIGTGETP